MLDRSQNLHNLNIRITARPVTWSIEDGECSYNFTGITQLDLDILNTVPAPLGQVDSATLSTPLAPDVGPDYGYVEGLAPRVYKRGSGDRSHPSLHFIKPGGTFDNVILTSPTRWVPVLVPSLFFFLTLGLTTGRYDFRLTARLVL